MHHNRDMRKILPVFLLLALSLLLAACGDSNNSVDRAEKVSDRQLSVQGQLCPTGQYDNSMLRCKVKTDPFSLNVPVPEGWSAYRLAWDQRGDVNGASQTGVASMIQDHGISNCRLMVSAAIGGISRKPVDAKRVQEHNLGMPNSSGAWHLGDKPLADGSKWFWVDVAGTPGVFVFTPQGNGEFLDWHLSSQSISMRGDSPEMLGSSCSLQMSKSKMLDVLTQAISQAKLSKS